jgi:hypothetical protein
VADSPYQRVNLWEPGSRWKDTQMSFIGRMPNGAHLRVWYFEDAPLSFA